MSEFRQRRIEQLREAISASERMFLMRQLGATVKAIGRACGVSHTRVTSRLAERSANIAELDRLEVAAARADINWPY